MNEVSPEEALKVMKVQEVITRAMSGQISWLNAAEILRGSPLTLRRWLWRYEQYATGYLNAEAAAESQAGARNVQKSGGSRAG